MSSEQVVFKLERVEKRYRLYRRPYDRLKDLLTEWASGSGSRRLRFEEHRALRNVDLTICRGETVGIIGINGSGKSTLLQILAGIMVPTSGSVLRSGRVAALLELGAGFNPQFTGRENIYLNAALYGLSSSDVDERLDSILDFADIGEFIDQPAKTYSSGMVVRLAFAIMAHIDADVLIIDEALAVGDVFFVQKCMGFLRRFTSEGTLVFVSHDTNMVLNLCTRAVLIDDGRLVMDGSPKQVVERYLARMYGGDLDCEYTDRLAVELESGASPATFPRDMRQDLTNASRFRNDIEVFEFDHEGASFGELKAEITGLSLVDPGGSPYSWVVGGEVVCVKISCRAGSRIEHPIIGFYVKDKLGQMVFGDNTFSRLSGEGELASVEPGDSMDARFRFRMPLLPAGDYTICAAIADGNQDEHQQQHWIHDALVIKSHSSSVFKGLVGVPMEGIELTVHRSNRNDLQRGDELASG